MAERGRPPKGVERSNILLRMPTNLIEQVDTFKERLEAERGGFVINRTDMLIRLIEVGLQTLIQARQPAPHPAHRPMTQPAPGSPTNSTQTPAVAEALADAAAFLEGEDDEAMPAPEAPAAPVPALSYDNTTVLQGSARQTAIPPDDYDKAKYVLGKLCPRRHEWGTTGQSLLSVHGHTCKECKDAYKRRKRAEKRQEQPA